MLMQTDTQKFYHLLSKAAKCLDAFINTQGMVNKEQFNNTILDSDVIQSKLDFSIGLAETETLFTQ